MSGRRTDPRALTAILGAALSACAPVYSNGVTPVDALPAISVARTSPERTSDSDAPEAEAVRADVERPVGVLNPALVGALESLIWPLAADGTGLLSSRYGDRVHPRSGEERFHTGLDLRARGGTPVYAAAGGTVALSGASGAYGNVVLVDHGGGLQTLYAHHERNLVGVGDVVRRGQPIALVGHTGNATGDHLHFEVRWNGGTVDPRTVMPHLIGDR
ncbi:MAG TPA: M23 family metallopeptidase [Gemmatimonadota bacterium]|nr:M23 family metallopeptidase [Gemmatimonadota bacterium]